MLKAAYLYSTAQARKDRPYMERPVGKRDLSGGKSALAFFLGPEANLPTEIHDVLRRKPRSRGYSQTCTTASMSVEYILRKSMHISGNRGCLLAIIGSAFICDVLCLEYVCSRKPVLLHNRGCICTYRGRRSTTKSRDHVSLTSNIGIPMRKGN